MIKGRCKNCKFYKNGYCDYVDRYDEDFPHLNSSGFCIEVYALDDTGMQVDLRVDEDFGCVKFATKCSELD